MRHGLIAAVCVAAVALTSPRTVEAQTEKEFAIWTSLFTTGQLHQDAPSPTFWLDLHARRGDNGTVHILRPGLGFAFASWVSLWAGYAWVPEWFDETGVRVDEHRIWEQLIFNYRSSFGLFFHSRSRFEQRFSEAGNDTAHRFRQFVRLNWQPKESVPIGIAFWDELFLGMHRGDWAKQGFDQNRVFIGPTMYAFDGIFRVEVGYLNVYLSRVNHRVVHVLAINFFLNFKGKTHAK